MKVIGLASNDTYICEVKHIEIEKFLNLYYGKLIRPKVGDVIDLGKGHDFAGKTLDALQKTQKFIESNVEIVKSITEGIMILKNYDEEDGKT